MARNFPTGGDKLQLTSTDTTYNSAFTVGSWYYLTGTSVAADRLLECAVGGAGTWQVLMTTNPSINAQRNGGTQMILTGATNVGTTLNKWFFYVFKGDGSGTRANHTFMIGDIATPLAANVTGGTDSGGLNPGFSEIYLGNRADGARTLPGRIAHSFFVPWEMTTDECERMRLGDWSVLYRGGTPKWFMPLQGANLRDFGDTGNTAAATGTSVVDDPPIAAGWQRVSTISRLVIPAGTTYTQGVSGALTPTGANTPLKITVYTQGVSGTLRPEGTLTVETIPGATVLPTVENSTTAGSSPVNKPSGGTTGDMYVIFTYHEAVPTPTLSATGFTLLDGPDGGYIYFGGPSAMWMGVLYRVHDGSEGSTFTVTGGGLGDTMCVLIRGADTSQAPLITAINGTTSNVTSISCNGVTTTEDNSLGLIHWTDVMGSTGTVSASGWTQVIHSGNEAAVFEKDLVTAGTESSVNVTWTGTSSPCGVWMLAFAPIPNTSPSVALTLIDHEGSLTPAGSLATSFISGGAGDVATLKPPLDVARRAAITHQRHVHRALSAQRAVTYFVGPVIHAQEFTGALTPAGEVDVLVLKGLASALTPAGVLSPSYESGSSTILYGDLVKQTNKVAAGTVTTAGSLDVSVTYPLTGTITPSGVVAKQTNKELAGALTPTGTLTTETVTGALSGVSPVIGIARNAAITLRRARHGAFGAQRAVFYGPYLYEVSLTGTITPSGVVVKQTNKAPFAGTITPAGAIAKQTNKVTSGGLTPSGAVDAATTVPLTGTIIPTGALTKLLSRTLAGSITPTGVVAKQTNKVTSGGLTPSGAVDATTAKALAGAITPGPSTVTRLTLKSPQGALVPTGAVTKLVSKTFTGSITPSGALATISFHVKLLAGTLTPGPSTITRLTNKTLAGALVPAGSLDALVAKTLTGTITPAGAVTKLVSRTLSGAIVPSGTVTKQISRALGGVITPTGSVDAQVVYVLTGSITPAGLVARQTNKTLSGAITPTGTIANVAFHALSVSGSITPAGSVARQTNKAFAATITPAGAITRLTLRNLAGEVTPAGALATQSGLTITMSGTIEPSGTLIRQISRALGGSLTPGPGAVARQTNKALIATITSSGAIDHLIVVPLAGALIPAGTLTKRLSRALAASISSSGAITRQINKALAGSIMPTGSLDAATAKRFTGTIVPAGALTRLTLKAAAGTCTPTGFCNANKTDALTGTLAPQGSVSRLVSKTFAGTITTAGTLTKVATKAFSATVATSGALAEATFAVLALSGAITPTGAVTKRVAKTTAGTVAPAGTCSRASAHAFAGSCDPTAGLALRTDKPLSGLVTMAGSLTATKIIGPGSGFSFYGDGYEAGERTDTVRARPRGARVTTRPRR